MDARSDSKHCPLAVDLDGTLIAADLLWESIFQLLRQNPLYLFMLPIWLLGGKCRLKCELAARVEIVAADLPYRNEILDWLRQEHKSGRRLVLATASHEKFSRSIAQYLGIFEAAHGTSSICNLKSKEKCDLLTQHYGDAGFDYAGNSRDDIALFDVARKAIVVAPDRAALKWGIKHGAEIIGSSRPSWRAVCKMLRVHQWLKNSLIGVPMVLSHEYLNVTMLVQCVIAFVAFSAAASAIYILNDLMDLPLDRRHASKKNRPFASGALSIPFGIKSAFLLLCVSGFSALMLDPMFGAVLAIYLVATTAYSLALKRMLLIDVMALASLYTLRILAGAAATEVTVSFWLLAFSVFFFLSLALVKRYIELANTELGEGSKIAGRGYRSVDASIIAQGGVASAFSSALVLALYIDSASVRELYDHPWMVWPLAPIVLYITLRIWVLAGRNELHDDPVVFIVRDWRSQLVILMGGLLLLAASLQ